MNYTGDRRSILTLAHELGHGLRRPGPAARAVQRLDAADDGRDRVGLRRVAHLPLAHAGRDRPAPPARPPGAGRIEDAIATTWRQITMNRFEHAVHTGRREGGELAPDAISAAWLETQGTLFDDSVDDRLRRLVELRAPLRVRPGLRLRVRHLRVSLLARDLPVVRAGGRGDRRPVLRGSLRAAAARTRRSAWRRSSASTSPTRRSGRVGSRRSTSCSARPRRSRTKRSIAGR